MKKLLLILSLVLFSFACKNNKNHSVPEPTKTTVQQLIVDTNSTCYKQSFKFKVLVTHNDKSTETLSGLSKQPSFVKCEKPNDKKWCLIDENKNLLSNNVGSFKVTENYFDSTCYFECQKSLIK